MAEQKIVRENVFKKSIQMVLTIMKNRKIKTSQLEETENLKVLTVEERRKIEKLKTNGGGNSYLNDKGVYKALDLSDISETEEKKIMTKEEREKVSKLVIDGDGTKTFMNDGTWKSPESAGVVNDNVIADDMAYSSEKVEKIVSDLSKDFNDKLTGKSPISHTHEELKMAHKHDNKEILDEFDTDLFGKIRRLTEIIDPEIRGLGDKVFCDDLTFKEIKLSGDNDNTGDGSGGGGLFDRLDENDFVIKEILDEETQKTIKQLSLYYPIRVLTATEYKKLQIASSISPNTIYITIDDNVTTPPHMNRCSIVITDEIGIAYSLDNNDGAEKIINDTLSAEDSTYSSAKIDKELERVENTIIAGNESMINLWQRVILNAENGTTKKI